MKPGVIVCCKDSDDTFRWMSDGWNEMKVMHTKRARDLFKKACRCIEKAKDVKEAIVLLRKAGFAVLGLRPRRDVAGKLL
jgi:hypothetical protein